MIKYTVRVNLAIFVSQSTDANKPTKALRRQGGGPGQNFHFEIFERAPLGETKAFYRMSKLIFGQKLA